MNSSNFCRTTGRESPVHFDGELFGPSGGCSPYYGLG
jgi:hypothetical protein